jgi:hypothetical protein
MELLTNNAVTTDDFVSKFGPTLHVPTFKGGNWLKYTGNFGNMAVSSKRDQIIV